MKYFTGIDVSLRFVSICVVDEAGRVQCEAKVPAEVDLIVASLRRVSRDIKQVGLEAGTLTQYLTYGLQKAGIRPLSGAGAPSSFSNFDFWRGNLHAVRHSVRRALATRGAAGSERSFLSATERAST